MQNIPHPDQSCWSGAGELPARRLRRLSGGGGALGQLPARHRARHHRGLLHRRHPHQRILQGEPTLSDWSPPRVDLPVPLRGWNSPLGGGARCGLLRGVPSATAGGPHLHQAPPLGPPGAAEG
eukprot:2288525-Pyramimonas_sp.AAC.1